MLEKIKAAAEHIRIIENSLREKADELRTQKHTFREALEKELVLPVHEIKTHGLIGAVDGGLLAQEMHGIDLIIARAAGVVFEYEQGVLVSHDYFPNALPEPDCEIKIGLDERDIIAFRSLFRLKKEIECAIGILEKKKLKCLMLDGSLLPLPIDKPNQESDIAYEYQTVIGLYKKLYRLAEEKDCILLGVIKDCRSRRFVDIMKTIMDLYSSDTVFLNHVLREGERTFGFKYTADAKKHTITQDLGAKGEEINAMYIKPVEGDRPLRIEFISMNFNEIASLVYSLSKINRTYAYPSILIEADLRAALDPLELERAQKSLALQSVSAVLPLRRNARPFR